MHVLCTWTNYDVSIRPVGKGTVLCCICGVKKTPLAPWVVVATGVGRVVYGGVHVCFHDMVLSDEASVPKLHNA